MKTATVANVFKTFLWTHFSLLKEAFIPVHFLIFVLMLSGTVSSLVPNINEKSILYVKVSSIQLIVQCRNCANLMFHFFSRTHQQFVPGGIFCAFFCIHFLCTFPSMTIFCFSLPNKHNTPAKKRIFVQYVTLFSFFFSSLRRDFPFRKIYLFVCICSLESFC